MIFSKAFVICMSKDQIGRKTTKIWQKIWGEKYKPVGLAGFATLYGTRPNSLPNYL